MMFESGVLLITKEDLMAQRLMVALLTFLMAGFGLAAAKDAGPIAASGDVAPDNSTGSGAKKCGLDGLIDDIEDNNSMISNVKGRGGYWFTFADKVGSNITPPGGSNFTMSPGGANGSAYAAHFSGKIGNGSIVFVGGGFNFTDPKAIYDASAYKGISFWAKVGPGAISSVRFKVSDINTDPLGKICGKNGTDDGCYNDFGKVIELTPKWTHYIVTFADMEQGSGWGEPRPAAITPSKLYGIVWEFNTKESNYDLWIDDIQFTGCPSRSPMP
jgi:hypothetical protein